MLKHHAASLTDKLSKAGMVLSGICAIHCVLTPLAVALLPFLGSTFLNNKVLEYSILIPGILLSTFITIRNYRKYHHDGRILAAVLCGFGIMIVGHLFGIQLVESVLSVIGALIAAVGLYYNMKATHDCANHVH